MTTLDNPEGKGLSFPQEYKENVFRLWFNNQQPATKALWMMIPEEWGRKVSLTTLQVWRSNDFAPRAERMNREMGERLEERMIQEKIEMLQRHGVLGRKMQNIAADSITKIIEDGGTLGEHAAVRLLVEGIRVERESVGLPQALEKLLNKDDEEILSDIQKIIGESEATILID